MIFVCFTENRLSPVVSDIKLESECDFVSDDDITNFDSKYQPKRALKLAIADWLMELSKHRNPPKSLAVATTPLVPAVPVPNLNMPPPVQAYNELETANLPTTTVNPVDPSLMNPTSTVLVNSLVDPLSSPENSPKHTSDTDSDITVENEPMDCVPSAISDSINVLENVHMIPKNESTDCLMQLDGQSNSSCTNDMRSTTDVQISVPITHEDLNLLISFFYLPFEYAAIPVQMLQDFHWLKTHSHILAKRTAEDTVEVNTSIKVWCKLKSVLM